MNRDEAKNKRVRGGISREGDAPSVSGSKDGDQPKNKSVKGATISAEERDEKKNKKEDNKSYEAQNRNNAPVLEVFLYMFYLSTSCQCVVLALVAHSIAMLLVRGTCIAWKPKERGLELMLLTDLGSNKLKKQYAYNSPNSLHFLEFPFIVQGRFWKMAIFDCCYNAPLLWAVVTVVVVVEYTVGATLYKCLNRATVNESFEKAASYGIQPNMIIYVMTFYDMSAATGASILGIWNALSKGLAIVGVFLADSYLGWFRVVAIGSISSFIGMISLWLTAMISQLKFLSCSQFQQTCDGTTPIQLAVLLSYFGFMSIGAGLFRPCSMIFGADQLEKKEPEAY